MAKCPQCDKPLRATEAIYARPVNPASGPVIANADKVKVGERPARNQYTPFCTLRCGWRYGKEMYEKRNRKLRIDRTAKTP